MKSESKTLRRIKMVLFMAVISAVFVTAVSAVHLVTRKTIKLNDSLFVKRSVLYTAGITPPKTNKALDELFNKKVKLIKQNGKLLFYIVSLDGKKIYVFIGSTAGLWGEIRAHVGLSSDLSTITGVNFIKQNETPGLGARISETWFKEQFRNKKPPMDLLQNGNASDEPHKFDAITGATITSKAVKVLINSTLKTSAVLLKKVKTHATE